MEAVFDDKTNILTAKIHSSIDHAVIYSVSTDQSAWGRSYTYLRDNNPALARGNSEIVGAINWKQKTIEVNGIRKKVKDLRRRAKGFRNKSRFWNWGEGRDEYDIVHSEDGWQALCTRTSTVEGSLAVPFRPHLFGKSKPLALNLSRVALAKDEIFLILVFIYCEAKRQERMDTSIS